MRCNNFSKIQKNATKLLFMPTNFRTFDPDINLFLLQYFSKIVFCIEKSIFFQNASEIFITFAIDPLTATTSAPLYRTFYIPKTVKSTLKQTSPFKLIHWLKFNIHENDAHSLWSMTSDNYRHRRRLIIGLNGYCFSFVHQFHSYVYMVYGTYMFIDVWAQRMAMQPHNVAAR